MRYQRVGQAMRGLSIIDLASSDFSNLRQPDVYHSRILPRLLKKPLQINIKHRDLKNSSLNQCKKRWIL